MIEYGLAHGLAQNLNYDSRINDERIHQQKMKQAAAESQAKLKAFEDDNQYMNAANSFDHSLIDNEAKKTINEIGKIVQADPNWESDPAARKLINEKRRYLKSNEHVIRGMASDESFRRLNDDLAKVAKSPNQYDTGAYQALLDKKNNYLKYGHQDGEEGLKRDGEPRAFVYDKPEDFVPLNEEALKTASQIKARKYKTQGNGGYEELVDEDSLHPAAQDFYNRHQRQIDVTYSPKTREEGINFAKELIRPGIDLKRKFGEPHYNDALATKKWEYAMGQKQANKPIDAYHEAVVSSRYNKLPTEAVTAMLGTTPTAKIYDADGSFKGTSNGQKFIPSGDYGQANTVKQGTNGKWGLSNNKTIGVAHGYIEMTETDYDNSGYDSDPKMRDKVVTKEITTPKGKKETVYMVPAQVEFDPKDEAKRFKFNNHVGMTNKQITALNPLEEAATQQQVFQDEAGNYFTQDVNGNYIPYNK